MADQSSNIDSELVTTALFVANLIPFKQQDLYTQTSSMNGSGTRTANHTSASVSPPVIAATHNSSAFLVAADLSALAVVAPRALVFP